MDLGPLIVILIRLIVPFSILRYPFWGTVGAAIADLLDVVMISAIGLGDFPSNGYTPIDKLLDTYYLIFCLRMSLKWTDKITKKLSIIMFSWRVIGVVVMEITSLRYLLFIFPNLFENFYLFWEARNKWFNKLKPTSKNLTIIITALLIPKLFQEWALHIKQLQPWEWIKNTFGVFR